MRFILQVFARTPPDGHRPPVPGIKTNTTSGVKNVDTQTSNSWIDSTNNGSPNIPKDKSNSMSPRWMVSPPLEKSPTKSNAVTPNRSSTEKDCLQETPPQHIPKYASSPKPNNSFWFARGPPDGAEIVPLSVEEIERYSMFLWD